MSHLTQRQRYRKMMRINLSHGDIEPFGSLQRQILIHRIDNGFSGYGGMAYIGAHPGSTF